MVRLVPAQPQQKQNKTGCVWYNHESGGKTSEFVQVTKQNPTFNLGKLISQMSKNKFFFPKEICIEFTVQ